MTAQFYYLFFIKYNSRCSDIDILLLCETFLNPHNYNLYPIEGYNFLHKSRQTSRGGVAMYINQCLKYVIREDLSYFEEGVVESVTIEVNYLKQNLIICEMYRVPNSNCQVFIDEFEKLINVAENEKILLIIGTDQNMDLLKYDTHNATKIFFDLITNK
eukprot:GHVU01065554.1.p1 GENE.GHVU01065554.1~~GHVU01065554.1.p1  ORF type:complete len:159 (-),score=13.08 GHVU01065554.1:1177-1653(-)